MIFAGHYLNELNNIVNHDCNAVIINSSFYRTYLVKSDVIALGKSNFNFKIDSKVEVKDSVSEIEALLKSYNFSVPSLIKEIKSLCEKFSYLAQSNLLRVKFETVTTDECKLFHVDQIGLRLVCTYFGTGDRISS